MTCYRAIVLVSIFCCMCSASQTVWAQAGTITPGNAEQLRERLQEVLR